MAYEEKRPLKVFLCHASGDKPPVRDLFKRLTTEGVDAWLDQEKLLPGQDWRLEIPKAVHEADVVVICLSNKSVTKEGYVQKEIKFALDIAEEKPEGTIFLIPARLEDCIVPERLSRWQWVDLYEENGFIKLLRSLKLRANVVNAVVEPISYEDTDKERGRRLDQLYTEGLAAFYTEDWDGACHRFQTILSELPGHKNAAEKLAEAEFQRKLANLYSQSTEAVQSENWPIAIKTLEELSQKSADYKDVAQLLKNARKQKQLKELYAEAKALHAAQKWQAVVRVLEQISVIEPNYPDPEGLLISAQKEVAEIKRIDELNSLYSRAVREMDAGQWVEACRLLEQVHKAQTGFLETERLLRKVEDEITKAQEHNQRNEQINVLYEQAHGLLRSKKWRKALDKIEEIEKLGNQFEDKDGIAEKAKIELEGEEKETQKQNQLAAMYAEAVRLLKEEKYQQAQDKWQEVKGIDPKYPDRQWVQRTSKRKLAESVKPTQIKSRFVITKPLLTGIVVFVVVAVAAIAGAILSNTGGQKILPTPTLAPTRNVIVNPPATNVPLQTNAPRPPTPVPPTSGYADPTMYDDFSDPTTSLDPSRWDIGTDDSSANVTKQNGILTITVYGYHRYAGVSARHLKNNVLNSPLFIELRFMLEPNQNGGTDMSLSFGDKGFVGCQIWGMNGAQDAHCSGNFFNQYKGIPGKQIPQGTWHTIRIEIDPSSMVFSYYLDGLKVGDYTPDRANELKNTQFTAILGSGCSGDGCIDKSTRTVTGHFDDIRIGAIEDDPNTLLYEDFNNSAYDGSYDKSKWETCDGSDPEGKVIQSNGVLSMAQAGTTTRTPRTNLCARKYENIKLSGVISFEAQLMFPNLQIGQLRINLVANNIGFSGCVHHYFYTFNDYSTFLHCDYLSSTIHWVSKKGKVVKPGTWHSVRIELDTSNGNLIYYLDGRRDDTYNASSEFSQKDYRFVFTISAESQNDVVGYIDNVRIRRIE